MLNSCIRRNGGPLPDDYVPFGDSALEHLYSERNNRPISMGGQGSVEQCAQVFEELTFELGPSSLDWVLIVIQLMSDDVLQLRCTGAAS